MIKCFHVSAALSISDEFVGLSIAHEGGGRGRKGGNFEGKLLLLVNCLRCIQCN